MLTIFYTVCLVNLMSLRDLVIDDPTQLLTLGQINSKIINEKVLR